jgi:hypothetical protein
MTAIRSVGLNVSSTCLANGKGRWSHDVDPDERAPDIGRILLVQRPLETPLSSQIKSTDTLMVRQLPPTDKRFHFAIMPNFRCNNPAHAHYYNSTRRLV